MANFTGDQLADFAIMAYEAGTPYWYGTCWYKCTADLLATKTKQYPSHYVASRKATYEKAIQQGKMCADCVGLIKGFFWSLNNTVTTKKANFSACPDYNANDFFNLCKEQGDISTIPNIRGLAVWQEGHIGIYIGDGWAIEARGFAYGVVKTKVANRTWKKWGRLPDRLIQYADAEPIPSYKLGERVLKKGDTGEDVQQLQQALIDLGFSCGPWGADGDFGTATQNAVKDFQSYAGLQPSGVFDVPTYYSLVTHMEEEGAPDQAEPDEEVDLPTLKQGSKDRNTKGTVAYLQDKLNELGSYGLDVDSDFGGKTKAAVEAFQRWKKLTVDGIVGPKTWGAIEK